MRARCLRASKKTGLPPKPVGVPAQGDTCSLTPPPQNGHACTRVLSFKDLDACNLTPPPSPMGMRVRVCYPSSGSIPAASHHPRVRWACVCATPESDGPAELMMLTPSQGSPRRAHGSKAHRADAANGICLSQNCYGMAVANKSGRWPWLRERRPCRKSGRLGVWRAIQTCNFP